MKLRVLRLAIIWMLIMMTIGCQHSGKTEYEIGEYESYLKIGTDITKDELMKICEEFKVKKDIEVDFSKSKFNSDGTIYHLDFNVKSSQGDGGYSGSPFNSRAGFRIKDGSFQVGTVPFRNAKRSSSGSDNF